MKNKIIRTILLTILLIIYMYISAIESIPNYISILDGDKLELKLLKGINLNSNKNFIVASNNFSKNNKIKIIEEKNNEKNNKKFNNSENLKLSLFNKINLKNINVDIIPKTKVIPIGKIIGMKLYTKGVLVVGMSRINNSENKIEKPYEKSGIEQGDTIISINDKEVNNTEQLIKEVNSSNGKELKVKYLKNNKIMKTSIKPVKSKDKYKIGLWVRDAAAGVGTLTFYEPSTNLFMALGHGISDIDTEKIIEISNGELINAEIISIKKGEKGDPGEIRGSIDGGIKIANINQNSKLGVYGKVTNKEKLNLNTNKEMEIALRSEIKEGKAKILCQLDNNGVKEYDIEIEKIYKHNNEDNKSMFIKIVDKELINKTGGIIQGMSGAPIIQNNKFVGAITNVLVNNPKYGYAIFADMMVKQLRKDN